MNWPPPPPKPKPRTSLDVIIRLIFDVTTFLLGVVGVLHETLVAQVERPWLLAVFAACLGLPAVIPHAKRGSDDR